jgi:hypothetical protein
MEKLQLGSEDVVDQQVLELLELRADEAEAHDLRYELIESSHPSTEALARYQALLGPERQVCWVRLLLALVQELRRTRLHPSDLWRFDRDLARRLVELEQARPVGSSPEALALSRRVREVMSW